MHCFSFKGRSEKKSTNSRSGSFKYKYENMSRSCSFKTKNELCTCPSTEKLADAEVETKPVTPLKTIETFSVKLTYKPRI